MVTRSEIPGGKFPKAIWAIVAFLMLVLIVAFAQKAKGPAPVTGGPKPVPGGGKAVDPVTRKGSGWKEVDRLISEQKYEAAAAEVEKILASAKAGSDEPEWTRALVKVTQLRMGLHGYETAVWRLREEPWPKAPLERATLDLFYAHSIVSYCKMYSWEIGQREKVESKSEVDLKAWTRDQLFAEAQRAYLEVWSIRGDLGAKPVTVLKEYIRPNDYPPGVRETLRDAVSYLFVELLADTSFWTPEQSNDLFRLDRKDLLSDGPTGVEADAILADAKAHPLQKVAAVIGDLEGWHHREGQREGQLEARLERLRRLHDSLTEDPDRKAILRDLEERIAGFSGVPWFSAGKAQQAELVKEEELPDSYIRARAIALEGQKAYPDSFGGQRCRHIVASIEAPGFSLAGMASDSPGKRSFAVSHRNMKAVYFRAYPVDLQNRIATSRDYNLLPQWQEVANLMKGTKPAASWKLDLPKTPDYRDHRTFAPPPALARGAYIVAVSAHEDFVESDNRILAVHFTASDLVLLTRQEDDGTVEVTAASGDSGASLANARINLYKYDYQKGHHALASEVSGADGVVRFPSTGVNRGQSCFLLGRRGDDLSLDTTYLGFYASSPPGESTLSLIYTDRSIYRPGQKIYWKALAYKNMGGQAPKGTVPNAAMTVTLHDGNNEVVGTAAVTTNAYGTASGEFVVPSGKILGAWRIDSSFYGSAGIRVEEYKRPTFEASIKEPASPLRLNRPANLTGEVKYYFGLPVVTGAVKWRVTREPVYPWWWGWYGWGRRTSAQTVASGATSLKEDGTFAVTFTPEVDERDGASKDVSYRYALSADVTDEGGETRSAEKSFRLGFVSIEASVTTEAAFFRDGEPGQATVTRSDLNGNPKAGKGSWRLVTLVQPPKALLPSEQPDPKVKEGDGDSAKRVQTPGDREKPRWVMDYSTERVLRVWEEGAEKAKGSLDHNAKGEAEIALPPLPSGAYRILYETADDFGAPCRTQKEFIVAAPRPALALPCVFMAENTSVKVGGTARFLVHSAIPGQILFFDLYRNGKRFERRRLVAGAEPSLIEWPVTEKDRGGFGATLLVLSDHQVMQSSQSVFVPWDDKELKVEFASFRDKVRPGAKETWRVTVKAPAENKGGKAVETGAAEILAYMYDRSLDLFAPHHPPGVLALYPNRSGAGYSRANLGQANQCYSSDNGFATLPGYPSLVGDQLLFYSGYGIGGPGRRLYAGRPPMAGAMADGLAMNESVPSPPPSPAAAPAMQAEGKVAKMSAKQEVGRTEKDKKDGGGEGKPQEAPVTQLRSNFAETAFWQPHLLTGADGSASIEFTVPDSVTSWNVWVHAVTKDLKGGSIHKETKSVKDLMTRPYLPRFLREGDRADIKVVVNNASDHDFSGNVTFEIFDPETNENLLPKFGLDAASAKKSFTVKKGGGASVAFPIVAPVRVGTVAFKVVATTGDMSDGELRPLPILPGRMHLMQSRFVTLKNKDRKELTFADMAKNNDPSLINEQMVVTLDAQLFYSVLAATPYLVNYPYECTEQTLNRFLSTGILSSLYGQYPAVGKMAAEFSKRQTPLETWDAADPNRKMTLEETPWLTEARGQRGDEMGSINVLDPRIAKANRDGALAKLKKAQTSNGAFPWFPGGPPSPYMTLYILYGFSKGLEFQVDVPRDMVQKAWGYMHQHFLDEVVREMMGKDCCWEFVTFLNYTLSNYPDASWTGGVFTDADRKQMIGFSFKHWKQHSPYSKCQLALTLKRMGRAKDAALVFSSVMDSAKSNPEEGTFWAAEDRSWLWYNDTIETHAFALRALMEVTPNDAKKDGLVQWIFLNKKLNHWKSTRATAEVIYSLVHYLKAEGALGTRESATVRVCNQVVTYTFEPDQYTGKKAQTVIPGDKIDAKTCSTVVVEKETKGFMFASATWQFSTERLPTEDCGDFLSVHRTYFKREQKGSEWVLKPLAEGATISAGDQVEVQISIRAKHPCEYVHLRDPRAAGLEPENAVSRFKWDLGIGWYEETRDSGTNFFFEWLPQGEYTFKYRLRANMAGIFKVSPATLQSMYAPEFSAYSAGAVLTVKGD